jgi:hypothetical protein
VCRRYAGQLLAPEQPDFDSADVLIVAGATEFVTIHLNGPNACGSGNAGEI